MQASLIFVDNNNNGDGVGVDGSSTSLIGDFFVFVGQPLYEANGKEDSEVSIENI